MFYLYNGEDLIKSSDQSVKVCVLVNRLGEYKFQILHGVQWHDIYEGYYDSFILVVEKDMEDVRATRKKIMEQCDKMRKRLDWKVVKI